jgi:integrase
VTNTRKAGSVSARRCTIAQPWMALVLRNGIFHIAPKSHRSLSVEEELRFLDHAYGQDGHTGLMLQTLLETGVHASELVQLRVEDVSLDERIMVVRQGKGAKQREVPIHRELAQLLRLHVGARRAGPLFASRERGSGPVPHVLTRQLVRAVARAAGITKRVYPHLLQHTVATRPLARGMDITDLREHKKLWGSRRRALEFNVDVICRHPTTSYAPTDSPREAFPSRFAPDSGLFLLGGLYILKSRGARHFLQIVTRPRRSHDRAVVQTGTV